MNYVIRNENSRSMFWSNEWGYGSLEGCELYTEDEMNDIIFNNGTPIEGEWVLLSQAFLDKDLYPEEDSLEKEEISEEDVPGEDLPNESILLSFEDCCSSGMHMVQLESDGRCSWCGNKE